MSPSAPLIEPSLREAWNGPPGPSMWFAFAAFVGLTWLSTTGSELSAAAGILALVVLFGSVPVLMWKTRQQALLRSSPGGPTVGELRANWNAIEHAAQADAYAFSEALGIAGVTSDGRYIVAVAMTAWELDRPAIEVADAIEAALGYKLETVGAWANEC